MTDESNVINRVDALIRRRRSFIAAPAGAQKIVDVPSPPPPAIEDDDLPVLTEVIFAEAVASEEPNERLDEARVALLSADIVEAIGQQLADDLPGLLEAALVHAGDELRAGISATLETALHDFLARRRQLRLPLDEPEGSD